MYITTVLLECDAVKTSPLEIEVLEVFQETYVPMILNICVVANATTLEVLLKRDSGFSLKDHLAKILKICNRRL